MSGDNVTELRPAGVQSEDPATYGNTTREAITDLIPSFFAVDSLIAVATRVLDDDDDGSHPLLTQAIQTLRVAREKLGATIEDLDKIGARC